MLDLGAIGPRIEADARFPNRTNVSFYSELAAGGDAGESARIRARIFERGVGETLSSGTGASGAAVAYALRTGPARFATRVTVVLDGGELEVDVEPDLHVFLTGWAKAVFEGRISDEFARELHESE